MKRTPAQIFLRLFFSTALMEDAGRVSARLFAKQLRRAGISLWRFSSNTSLLSFSGLRSRIFIHLLFNYSTPLPHFLPFGFLSFSLYIKTEYFKCLMSIDEINLFVLIMQKCITIQYCLYPRFCSCRCKNYRNVYTRIFVWLETNRSL